MASSAVLQRRHDDARRHLREGIEYCTERDLDSWTRYLEGWEAQLHLDSGELGQARARAETILRHPELASVGAIQPLVTLALVRGRTGEGDVDAPLTRLWALASGTGEMQRVAPAVAARCEVAWIEGDVDRAAAIAAETWPLVESADCSWNRGSVARWLGADRPGADRPGADRPDADRLGAFRGPAV